MASQAPPTDEEICDHISPGVHRVVSRLDRVGAHRSDHEVLEHPSVGPITVDCDVLTDGDAELKIVIKTAAPDSEDESKVNLAMVAGVQELNRSTQS